MPKRGEFLKNVACLREERDWHVSGAIPLLQSVHRMAHGCTAFWRRGVKRIPQNEPQAMMRRAHPIIRSLAHIPLSAGSISPGTLQHHSKDRQAGSGDNLGSHPGRTGLLKPRVAARQTSPPTGDSLHSQHFKADARMMS